MPYTITFKDDDPRRFDDQDRHGDQLSPRSNRIEDPEKTEYSRLRTKTRNRMAGMVGVK